MCNISGNPALPEKFVLILTCAALLSSCLVKRRCFRDDDCPEPRICSDSGRCVYECDTAADCEEGWECEGHRCVPAEVDPIECPEGMAPIENTFCMDIWEASRPDATETDPGRDESRATTRPGVLPWTGDDLGRVVFNEDAAEACEAAGKRLCTPSEWQFACEGTDATTYVYGDAYSASTCNSLDLYGNPEEALVAPTGAFPGCVNEWGIYDLCGNAYEHVQGGSDALARGGSYKSLNPMEETHRCDYVPTTWVPCYCALGFRCCISPDEIPEEAPEEPEVEPVADATTSEDAPDAVGDPDVVDEGAMEEPDGPSLCPVDMVFVESYCIDRWEASRSNATATHHGTSSTPTSRPGVLPWIYATLTEARDACTSVGRHLCTASEWTVACSGPSGDAFTYGPAYEPATCNGMDTFCDCSDTPCSGLTTCPYPGCYAFESSEGGGPCGGSPHMLPTGSLPGCTNGYGIMDASGNAWEIVDMGDASTIVRGGGYDSLIAETQHSCGYSPSGWTPCACSRGFRCCAEAYE